MSKFKLTEEQLAEVWSDFAVQSSKVIVAANAKDHDNLYKALDELDTLRRRLQRHEVEIALAAQRKPS